MRRMQCLLVLCSPIQIPTVLYDAVNCKIMSGAHSLVGQPALAELLCQTAYMRPTLALHMQFM